ncbi:MAG: hypothetical protein V1776_02220 [Candidatus Diapherotrites archaeon]
MPPISTGKESLPPRRREKQIASTTRGKESKWLLAATWLAKQATHNPGMRTAIHPFRRLALIPSKERNPTLNGKMKERIEDYVVIAGNEPIPKEWLQRIEQMVMSRGLDETSIHIAHQFPRLTELLTDPNSTIQFVNSQKIPEKWRRPLGAFARCPNEQLRAVGLLLYLRKAHRTYPNELNEQAIQLMRRMH